MNERIKELMNQAGIDVEAVENLGEMPTALKFAELIIAECTQVLFDEAERLNGLCSDETNLRISDDLESCAEQCMENIVKIEEHFGVK